MSKIDRGATAVVCALIVSATIIAVAEVVARFGPWPAAQFTPTDTYAAWIAAASALFATATGLVALVWIRQTLIETRRTADAAVQANANSREIGQAEVRAYVVHDRVDWSWHRDPKLNRLFYRFTPRWKNVGATPTRGLRIFSGATTARPGEVSSPRFLVPEDTDYVPIPLQPGGDISGDHIDIFSEDIAKAQVGDFVHFFWGVATYRDVFSDTPDRVTKFCVYVSGTSITGDPLREPDESTNVVRMTFRLYREHNCSDDECATVAIGVD